MIRALEDARASFQLEGAAVFRPSLTAAAILLLVVPVTVSARPAKRS